jgi:hypothetical protein
VAVGGDPVAARVISAAGRTLGRVLADMLGLRAELIGAIATALAHVA